MLSNISELFRKFSKITKEDPKMFRLNHEINFGSFSIETWGSANSSANVTKSISSHVKDMIFLSERNPGNSLYFV